MSVQRERQSSSAREQHEQELEPKSPARRHAETVLAGKPYGEQIQLLKPDAGLALQEAKAPAPPMPIVQYHAERAIQAKGADGQSTESTIRSMAAQGVEGSGSRLPHYDRLQRAFGHHDLSGVHAHVGGAAERATKGMGATAYATGSAIAFRSSPDLHTAAHEAAHVVQQRAGVQVPGGVGQRGDVYEQHADAVADRVVQGRPVAPLLDSVGGGKSGISSAIQFYAGNQSAEEQAAIAKHGTEQDTMGNPALKAEFETLLAQAILLEQAFYRPVVESVSYGIYLYLQARAKEKGEKVARTVEQLYDAMTFMYNENNPDKKIFYGRIVEMAKSEEEKTNYYAAMTNLLQKGAGTVQNHLLAHQCFNDHILNGEVKDVEQGRVQGLLEQVQTAGQAKIDEVLALSEMHMLDDPELLDEAGKAAQVRGATNVAPKALRAPVSEEKAKQQGLGGTDPFGEKNKGVGGRAARGRYTAKQLSGNAELAGTVGNFGDKTKPNQITTQSGIQAPGAKTEAPKALAEKLTPEKMAELGLTQEHSQGITVYVLDEAQKFIQEARTIYNMPLAAGISGTTTDLHEVAKMFGVAGDYDVFKYQLACLGHLITGGAHSVHEIMSAAALNTSVSYEPGNYRSLLTFGFDQVATIMALFNDPKYAKVPGIGADAGKVGG